MCSKGLKKLMKIEKTPEGFTLRHAPSETVVSSIVLVIATLGLIFTLSDPSRYLPETLLMLAGCALLYAAGIKAVIRERRCRLTVTKEGIRVRNKRAGEHELLRWEDVKDWGTAVVLHKGRYGLYHPRVLLFFSDIPRATAEDACTSPHIIELVKFDREALEESGVLPYCREHLTAAQGDQAPAERDQWMTAGHA